MVARLQTDASAAVMATLAAARPHLLNDRCAQASHAKRPTRQPCACMDTCSDAWTHACMCRGSTSPSIRRGRIRNPSGKIASTKLAERALLRQHKGIYRHSTLGAITDTASARPPIGIGCSAAGALDVGASAAVTTTMALRPPACRCAHTQSNTDGSDQSKAGWELPVSVLVYDSRRCAVRPASALQQLTPLLQCPTPTSYSKPPPKMMQKKGASQAGQVGTETCGPRTADHWQLKHTRTTGRRRRVATFCNPAGQSITYSLAAGPQHAHGCAGWLHSLSAVSTVSETLWSGRITPWPGHTLAGRRTTDAQGCHPNTQHARTTFCHMESTHKAQDPHHQTTSPPRRHHRGPW